MHYYELEKSALFLEQEKSVICYYLSDGKILKLKLETFYVKTYYAPLCDYLKKNVLLQWKKCTKYFYGYLN